MGGAPGELYQVKDTSHETGFPYRVVYERLAATRQGQQLQALLYAFAVLLLLIVLFVLYFRGAFFSSGSKVSFRIARQGSLLHEYTFWLLTKGERRRRKKI